MKKTSSKSTISKKNKTISNIPDSKKSSRIVKANSCVKINSLSSEQNSRHHPLSHTINHKNVSQKQILPYELSQLSHQIDKPQSSNRPSYRVEGKSSIQTIPIQRHESREDPSLHHLKQKNEEITKENAMLKQKCCELQEMSLRDKEKIKNLIIRINEVKQSNTQASEMKQSQPSNAQLIFNQHEISAARLPSKAKLQTPYKAIASGTCQSRECQQRKKYLQNELYRERIVRDKLEVERRQWQHNKQQLKQQYNELLMEIHEMRDKQY